MADQGKGYWGWDPTTPANNGTNDTTGGINIGENATAPSAVNNAMRGEMLRFAQYLQEQGFPTAGGTANALTLTPNNVINAYANSMYYGFKAASANTTAATLAVSGLTAKAIRKIVGGTDIALAANDIQANGRYTVVYDTAANGAAGAWILTGTPPEVGVAIDGLTAKTTLVGGDEMIIADSAASFAGKKATLTNLLKMLNVSGNFNLALDLSGAAAGQIVFPAAQNASAGANTLDDYEEGTWTPAIRFGGAATGLTYSLQTGQYTKIGNLVIAGFQIGLSAKGSSTGAATMIALPFTVNTQGGFCFLKYYAGMASISGGIFGDLQTSTTTLNLNSPGAVVVAGLTEGNFTNSSSLYGACVYTTT